MRSFRNYHLLLIIFATIQLQGCSTINTAQKSEDIKLKKTYSDYTILKSTLWKDSVIAKGIVWKTFHYDNLFSSRQYVTVLDIDMRKSNIRIDIPYITEGFLKTSEAATENKAVAAINGSYFDTKKGGSVVFFKKDNIIVKNTTAEFTQYRENGGFALTQNDKPQIISRPAAGWINAKYKTILTSGPLLILDNKILQQEQTPFNQNRHPRTAIGITDKNHIIAVVVDGRNAKSQGMNINELSLLMKSLGCTAALNLDGGGSSTMWINKKGIVNHPSDNKLFDHEGERAVANVIIFK